jgi:uncharacterized protein (DUF4415 family)
MRNLNAKEIKRQLDYLRSLPDDRIDTSDIPEVTEEQFRKGVRGLMYRPVKKPVTMRLDADVIAWLKAEGKGYQTKANALLRREMLRTRAEKKKPERIKSATPKRQRAR